MPIPRGLLIALAPVALLGALAAATRLASPPQKPEPTREETREQAPPPALADEATRAAVTAVIEKHVAALRARDFQKALTLCADAFVKTTDPKQYGKAMEQLNSALIEHRGKLKVDVFQRQGNTVAFASVPDIEGPDRRFRYEMRREKDAWRVYICAPMGGPARMTGTQ